MAWAAAIAAGLLLLASPLAASPTGVIGVWSPGFYSAPEAPPAGDRRSKTLPQASYPSETACLAAVLAAERRHAIPRNLLLAMAFTESGRAVEDGPLTSWPWTVNVEGRGFFFPDKAAAVAFVASQVASGKRSIDVGCMQVNLRWHPGAFPDLETAFDPFANADYAGRLLLRLAEEHFGGDHHRAVGAYHSFTPDLMEAYQERVRRNQRFAEAARDYVEKVVSLPAGLPAQTLKREYAWGQREGSALAFMSSLFATGTPQPFLPSHGSPLK
jgi:hypothetical protein